MVLLRTGSYGDESTLHAPDIRSISSNVSTSTLVDLNAEPPGSVQRALQDGNDSRLEQETLLKSSPLSQFRRPSTTEDSQRPKKYVQWGVNWHQQPMFMILFALAGLVFAVGHHFYYVALNGTRAGSERRQQWAHAFGNALAVLVVTTLAAANRIVYNQYTWTLVRRKAFSLRSLDALFALTSDPLGFSDMNIFRHAPLAALLAALCWVTSLAGLLPPGSLVVIEGTIAQRATLSMPSLNWMISDPWTNPWTSDISSDLSPSTLVTGVVTRTAEEMRIIDFVPPALNSSYELEVRGPFLQCEEANDTQLAVFKFYQNESFNGHVLTSSTRPLAPTNLDTIDVWMGTIVSIFDPWLVDGSWANSAKNFTNSSLPDGFGSLLGYIPDFLKDSPYCSNNSTYANCLMIPRQLWMLTSNDSIVCTLGNATRTAQFSFVDGTQTVRYGELQDFEPVFVPKNGNLQINSSTSRVGLVNDEVYSYMAVFQSLAAKLIGSVTILLGTGPGAYQTSSILLTGLSACEEFSDNLWTQDYPDYQYIFNEPAYTCRNKTVAKAIEDLSANITISLMSSSNFTGAPNSSLAEVTFTPTHNIYQYNPFLLILSYGIPLVFSFFSLLLGIHAFRSNGVSHSTAFSAIVATTRNPALDALSEGHSLGAFPLDNGMAKVKLKFGGIEIGEKGERAGFGLAGEVNELRNRGKYI